MDIEVVQGDITVEATNAIVNAANSELMGGGGVDGAIHRAGGAAILEACRQVRRTTWVDGLPTGQAVATTGGDLPARWVIHTVGPKAWEHPDGGSDLLADCHRNCLVVAEQLGARSIAFPAISCGVYGWSTKQAAPIAIGAVRDYAEQHSDSGIDRVRFVLFSAQARDDFAAALAKMPD